MVVGFLESWELRRELFQLRKSMCFCGLRKWEIERTLESPNLLLTGP